MVASGNGCAKALWKEINRKKSKNAVMVFIVVVLANLKIGIIHIALICPSNRLLCYNSTFCFIKAASKVGDVMRKDFYNNITFVSREYSSLS